MRRWPRAMLEGGAVALLATLAGSVACGDPGGFVCARDDQCERAGEAGTCEAGFCAFMDPDCESGKRYGELSGERAGECVPGDGSDTGTSTSSGDDGSPVSSSEGTSGGGDSVRHAA